MTPLTPPPADLLERVRDEYRDMPGLGLTPSQVQRVFGLEPVTGGAILEALVRENFLFRTSQGLFVRSATLSTR